MSLSTILISSESMDESVRSSASYVILSDSKAAVPTIPAIAPKIAPEAETTVVAPPTTILDLLLESDSETEPLEAPPSPDYVPASPDYFPRSDSKSDPEESSKEDPLGGDSSDDYKLEATKPLVV
ncbi:hypothetical protein Tco_0709731 [Tanacetum coccineum]